MSREPLNNEKLLLELIAKGDENAFTEIFNAYRNRIYTVAFRITDSEILAEEIVQDVFLKIWLKRENLLVIEDFSAYLFIIARNHTYSCLRVIARGQLNEKDYEHYLPSDLNRADSPLLYKEYDGIIKDAVRHLPLQQRTVYELIRIKGLTREQVAGRLKISPQTVKVHLNIAVKKVRAFCLARLSGVLYVLWMLTK